MSMSKEPPYRYVALTVDESEHIVCVVHDVSPDWYRKVATFRSVGRAEDYAAMENDFRPGAPDGCLDGTELLPGREGDDVPAPEALRHAPEPETAIKSGEFVRRTTTVEHTRIEQRDDGGPTLDELIKLLQRTSEARGYERGKADAMAARVRIEQMNALPSPSNEEAKSYIPPVGSPEAPPVEMPAEQVPAGAPEPNWRLWNRLRSPEQPRPKGTMILSSTLHKEAKCITPPTPAELEDVEDAEIARMRLEEIGEHPERLVSGDPLRQELEEDAPENDELPADLVDAATLDPVTDPQLRLFRVIKELAGVYQPGAELAFRAAIAGGSIGSHVASLLKKGYISASEIGRGRKAYDIMVTGEPRCMDHKPEPQPHMLEPAPEPPTSQTEPHDEGTAPVTVNELSARMQAVLAVVAKSSVVAHTEKAIAKAAGVEADRMPALLEQLADCGCIVKIEGRFAPTGLGRNLADEIGAAKHVPEPPKATAPKPSEPKGNGNFDMERFLVAKGQNVQRLGSGSYRINGEPRTKEDALLLVNSYRQQSGQTLKDIGEVR